MPIPPVTSSASPVEAFDSDSDISFATLAETFLSKPDHASSQDFINELRATYDFDEILMEWVEDNEFLAISKAFVFLTPTEKSDLSKYSKTLNFVLSGWNFFLTSNLLPEARFQRAFNLFILLNDQTINSLIGMSNLSNAATGFLIAALPDLKKNRFLNTLFRKYSFETLFVLFRVALKWTPQTHYTLNIAEKLMKTLAAQSKMYLLEDTARKNPSYFTPFLCYLPATQMDFLQGHLSNPFIVRGIQSFKADGYASCQAILKSLKLNGASTVLVNLTNLQFNSPVTGTTHTPLAALPQHLGLASPQIDDQGFDNFKICYEQPIQSIPPLLIALGAQDSYLNRWLIDASRLFTEDQLRHFFWALPYSLTSKAMPYFREQLKGPSLEATLESLPPKLRNLELDRKMSQLSETIKKGNEALATLQIDSTDDETNLLSMMSVADSWELQLNALLKHPDSLPFWRQSRSTHPLYSLKPSLEALAGDFHKKLEEARTTAQKPLSNQRTLSEAPPPYLTDSLKSHLGNPNLEAVGIRYQEDIDQLGVSLTRISDFESFEASFLDDLSLLFMMEWERLKWGNDLQAWKAFIISHGGHPPADFDNPFRPLVQYLKQPELAAAWDTLKSKQIFTLSGITESCMTESDEDLFDLANLAKKLLV